MSLLLTALVVISAILMVGVILLQQGKGAELGAAFGRGAQGGLFGAAGAANFLTRTTKWLAVAFFGAALTLSLFVSDSSREGVLDELRQEAQSESVFSGEESESAAPDEESLESGATDNEYDAGDEEVGAGAGDEAGGGTGDVNTEEESGGAKTPD